MVEKELLLAIAAYNLVRAVMCMAARRANLKPTPAQLFVRANRGRSRPTGSRLCRPDAEYQQRLDRMLRYAVSG